MVQILALAQTLETLTNILNIENVSRNLVLSSLRMRLCMEIQRCIRYGWKDYMVSIGNGYSTSEGSISILASILKGFKRKGGNVWVSGSIGMLKVEPPPLFVFAMLVFWD